MNISVSQSPLGTKQLLILAAVRHLQPTNPRRVQVLLGKAGGVNNQIYGFAGYDSLMGTYLTNHGGVANTLQLTEAGRAAVADIALIWEAGAVRVGRWEAVA